MQYFGSTGLILRCGHADELKEVQEYAGYYHPRVT
jgi:hypothetical protein